MMHLIHAAAKLAKWVKQIPMSFDVTIHWG
jgi:hypothetical protein